MNPNHAETKTMRRLPLGLGALLAAQFALAAGLVWWPAQAPQTSTARAMFSFDAEAVDRLVIEGPAQARVELKRQGSGPGAGWVVAGAGDFPADPARVRAVIDRLHGLKVGAPVATSAEALERFKVADAAFERLVQAQAGDRPVATLRLGSAQGSRQTAARSGDAREVLGVDWPTWELATSVDDWLDKTVLRLPKAEIAAIEVDGLRLVAADTGSAAPAAHVAAAAPAAASAPAGAASTVEPAVPAAPRWNAYGLAAGQALDDEAADRLAQAIADIGFVGLRAAGERAGTALGTPERRLVVQRRGAQPVAYTLYRPGDGDERLLAVEGRPETFRLAGHQARPLVDGSTRDALTGGAAR